MIKKMSESVVIVEVLDQLYKFSTFEDVDVFCKSFEKGTIVKVYVPDKIATMEVM